MKETSFRNGRAVCFLPVAGLIVLYGDIEELMPSLHEMACSEAIQEKLDAFASRIGCDMTSIEIDSECDYASRMGNTTGLDYSVEIGPALIKIFIALLQEYCSAALK
ncbi:hypothetical protein GCK32_011253 [Trichostrongylus colubriformis]|uniref:Uncharacterized protein n=1 Tax=Trichostrongylus colubriformis TaxID=6319 RepID=A0AAN8IJD2_TRICO